MTISRKKFLAGLTLIGIELTLPSFLRSSAYFLHGIASGDPLQDRVIIWTRISNTDPLHLLADWEIAENPSFSKGLQKGQYAITADHDHTVKIDVEGLKAGHTYYYRFRYKGVYSITGNTKTLPAALNGASFSMAVVACNNWEDGYFNSFRFLAKKKEVDVVLHLGDYIYEYGSGEYGNPAVDRTNLPLHEILTLQDYRQRYAHYRTDADLQLLHAQKPFIMVWDDHEFANDAFVDGAQNNQPGEADWTKRKQAAMQAWFEWLPVRAATAKEMRRKISIGEDIELLLMDQRLTGRTAQKTKEDPAFFDADRSMLGKEQLNWLLQEIAGSKASWQLIGNQVMFTGYNVKEGRKQPKYADWWLGYPAERQQIIDAIKARQNRNTIFLTGDHHQTFVLGLQSAGTPYAWELLTPSITSKNLDRLTPQEIADTEEMLQDPSINPHLLFADVKSHGYYITVMNNTQLRTDYYVVDTVLHRDAKEYKAASFVVDKSDFLLKRI